MSSEVEQHLMENMENVAPLDKLEVLTTSTPQTQDGNNEEAEEEEKQQSDDFLHDSISSPSIVEASEPEPIECPYTIVAIDGLDFIQRNFAKYNLGDKSAEEFVGAKRVTLSKRFQLLERGFLLKLKNEREYRNLFKIPNANSTEVKLIVQKN